MKIILHGATSGSNFGDFLFADLFYKTIKEYNKEEDIYFFEFPRLGIGKFFRQRLSYNQKLGIKELFAADLLIYISGGYFGERSQSLIRSIYRYCKYVIIGNIFICRRRPILIIGIGGGPFYNKILQKSMMRIIRNSQIVSVRDEETAKYFELYGVSKNILITTDTAQSITEQMIPCLDKVIESQISRIFDKKHIVFLHLSGEDKIDRYLLQSIVPPLNAFLSQYPEFGVIVGYDMLENNSTNKTAICSALECKSIYIYEYQEPWQLCSLLNRVDMIVTSKLHVGIIGATLSKSVISFPLHAEKTQRYYKQIGESARCLPLIEATFDRVLTMMKQFSNKQIFLEDKLRIDAKKNLEMVAEYILHTTST